MFAAVNIISDDFDFDDEIDGQADDADAEESRDLDDEPEDKPDIVYEDSDAYDAADAVVDAVVDGSSDSHVDADADAPDAGS